MTSVKSIRNIFMIATSIFTVSMATVFLLIGGDQINIEADDLKANVLTVSDTNEIQSEEFYRGLLDNNEGDLLVLKENATLQFIDDNLLEQLGYSEENLIDENLFSIIHPKDLPELGNNFVKNFNKEDTTTTQENIGPVRFMTVSGSYIPYLISLVPLHDNAGGRVSTAVLLTNTSTPIGGDEEDVHDIAAAKEVIKIVDNNKGHGNDVDKKDEDNPALEEKEKKQVKPYLNENKIPTINEYKVEKAKPILKVDSAPVKNETKSKPVVKVDKINKDNPAIEKKTQKVKVSTTKSKGAKKSGKSTSNKK